MFKEALPRGIAPYLTDREKFHPYARYEDEEAWAGLTPQAKEQVLAVAEKYLDFCPPLLPARRYRDFRRSGNRSEYENPYFERRRALVYLALGECVERRGRFIDTIIDLTWAICEETSWCVPAHNAAGLDATAPLPDARDQWIDLFNAQTGENLAWLYYILGQRLAQESYVIPDRLEYELERRILTPFYQRGDYWWLGNGTAKVNNWNPWCLSNILSTVLLMEKNEDKRARAVDKALSSLERFIQVYPDDGGCDEGPGYWDVAGGALFDGLHMLYLATDGAVSFFDQPLIQAMGRFIYKLHIDDNWMINFADGGARTGVDPALVYMYGKMIGDEAMMGMGADAMRRKGHPRIPYRHPLPFKNGGGIVKGKRLLMSLFADGEIRACTLGAPYGRYYWLDGLQVMVARQRQGDYRGFFLAAKGGNNNESHNHNDVGSFIAFRNGEPLFIDLGVEDYTRKTFSDERYTIWTMRSDYHNLARVNGFEQYASARAAAKGAQSVDCDGISQMTVDIAAAYPEQAGLEQFIRTIGLNREREEVFVKNRLVFREPAAACFFFMTPLPPEPDNGRVKVGSSVISYDPALLTVRTQRLPVTDSQLLPVWGPEVYRVIFETRREERKLQADFVIQ